LGGQGQAHTLDSETKDTLNSRVVPIVFVPGVMGTRLDIEGAASDWDPDDTTEMAGWLLVSRRRKMRGVDFRARGTLLTGLSGFDSGNKAGNEIAARPRLRQIALDQMNPRPASRGQSSAIIQFWQKRGWGEVVWNFYGQVLMEMAEQLNPGNGDGELRPVYAAGYDWRQSSADSAATLIARVNEVLSKHPLAKQVILVTHSMGGQVTRAALQRGLEPKVLGVIHTVIPADGAVVAYRRFLTGVRKEFNESEFGLDQILGKLPLEYALMQSVLRGPTELLPSDSYPEAFLHLKAGITNKFLPDIFAEYQKTEAPGILFKQGGQANSEVDSTIRATDVENLRARFREAGVFTRSIAGRVHPRTFLMFGDGQITDLEFDWTKGTPTQDGSNMQAMVLQRKEGDATVPRPSSRFTGATSALGRDGFPARHAECFTVPEFRRGVITRLRKLLTP
jgi:pimeloyl-ACP methyl ester carboxylesterase